jgi:hypothetical protein
LFLLVESFLGRGEKKGDGCNDKDSNNEDKDHADNEDGRSGRMGVQYQAMKYVSIGGSHIHDRWSAQSTSYSNPAMLTRE